MSISFLVWRQLDLGKKDFDGEMVGEEKILERIEDCMAGEGMDPVNMDRLGWTTSEAKNSGHREVEVN